MEQPKVRWPTGHHGCLRTPSVGWDYYLRPCWASHSPGRLPSQIRRDGIASAAASVSAAVRSSKRASSKIDGRNDALVLCLTFFLRHGSHALATCFRLTGPPVVGSVATNRIGMVLLLLLLLEVGRAVAVHDGGRHKFHVELMLTATWETLGHHRFLCVLLYAS